MIDDNLIQLSFEQLEEIQARISQVISEKRSARISDAIKDVLTLLNTHYADVSLWDFLNELADTYQGGEMAMPQSEMIPLDLSSPTLGHQPDQDLPQPDADSLLEDNPRPQTALDSQDENIPILYDPGAFYERLRVIRNEVLQHEEARLIWLTNDGSQKTSKVSGKGLADLLQETIKKLERLCEADIDTNPEMTIEDVNREVLRISEWSEMHLGVSLRKGTLTVITPFVARNLSVKGYPPMITISDMQKQASKGELHIPFS